MLPLHAMNERLDHFEGPQDAYTTYLELQVTLLRQHHWSCEQALQRQLESAQPSIALARNDPAFRPCNSAKRRRGLEVVEYDHHTTRSKLSNLRKKTQKPRWEQVAAVLIGETPEAQDWQNLLKQKGIYEIMSSGSAITHLLSVASQGCSMSVVNVAEVDPFPSNSALGRIQAYASAAIRRETSASVALVLANFQKFLALSACAVLAATGSPDSTVFDIVRICIGNVSTEYCSRMLRVVVYLNELLDTLYMHGWGLRASELLLLWNRSPSFFYHLTSAGDNGLQYFKSELCGVELTSTVGRIASWTPLFVPSLVYNIIGKSVDIANIAHILGYKHSDMLNVGTDAA